MFDSSFDDNSAQSLDPLVEPNYAGSRENVVLNLTDCQKGMTYFIALRAVDKALKVSRVSNIASFYIPSPVLLIEYIDDGISRQSDTPDYSFPIGIGILLLSCLVSTFLFFIAQTIRNSSQQYRGVPLI